MLIDLGRICKRNGLRPKGVIHAGAHLGQEYDTYKKVGIKNVVFIEPCADQFSKLHERFKEHSDVKLFNVACGNYTGQVMMNIETANGGQSNSILTPAKHLTAHPNIPFIGTEIVDITTLDSLDFDRSLYDMLMMDCQGYEAEVLKGATETLKNINIVYTEVNNDELYEGCARINDIKKLLPGFRSIQMSMTHWNWGDMILKRI